MLIELTYNCDPKSLRDLTQDEFVDAFENEVVADPRFRETRVMVTFHRGSSRVTSVSVDSEDDSTDPAHYSHFQWLADKAVKACRAERG